MSSNIGAVELGIGSMHSFSISLGEGIEAKIMIQARRQIGLIKVKIFLEFDGVFAK